MFMDSKLTIIIPTFNRPQLLYRLLKYYENVDCRNKIIIADSSNSYDAKKNSENIEYFHNKLDILYKLFPSDIDAFSKCAKALNLVESKYIVFCADKDFVIFNSVFKCIEFLENNSDYSMAGGIIYSVYFSWLNKFNCLPNLIKINRKGLNIFSPNSNYDQERPDVRLKQFIRNSYSTFYAVHRKDSILNNLNLVVKYTQDHKFFELLLNCISIVQGKFKCFDILYQVRQVKHSISGSKQWENKWNRIFESGVFESRYERFIDCLSGELVKKTGMHPVEARSVAKEAVDIKIVPIKDSFKRMMEYKRLQDKDLSLIHKFYKLIVWRINLLKVVLPIVMRLALSGNRTKDIIRFPIKTFRQVLSEQNDYDRFNTNGNALRIDSVLNSKSPYHADLMPIYNIVKRYPDGIEAPLNKVIPHQSCTNKLNSR